MELVPIYSSLHSEKFKKDYVTLLAAGLVESQILKNLKVDWLDFFEVVAADPDFRSDIELAKKERASRWVDKIAVSLEKEYVTEVKDDKGNVVERVARPPTKDELNRDKLDFEKLKFLAQADDPDKYGNASKGTKVDVSIGLTDHQLLSPEKSIEVLQNDPFRRKGVIDVDFEKIKGLDDRPTNKE